MKTKKIDERKMFVIRLNKEEYSELEKAKTKENLPMKDSDIIKLFLLRYLGGSK
jgi:hypothetical protein